MQIQTNLGIIKILFKKLPYLIQTVINGVTVDIQRVSGFTHILIVPEITAELIDIRTFFMKVRFQEYFE